MQLNLNAPDTPVMVLHREIDNWLRSVDAAEHVRRQFFLLPPLLQPPGMINPDFLDNRQFQPLSHLGKLCSLSKISALFGAIGFAAASKKLPELTWQPLFKETALPAFVEVKEMLAFSEEVSAMTEGVIGGHQLSPCDVLKMQMLACMERCAVRLERVSHPVWSSHFASAQPKKTLEEVRAEIVRLFELLELIPREEDLSPILLMRTSIGLCLDDFERFKTHLERGRYPDHAMKDCLHAIKILKLLRRALERPISLLPILMKPIRTKGTADELNLDSVTIDTTGIKIWLDDFLTALQSASADFFQFIDSTVKTNRVTKKFAPLYSEAFEGREQLLREAVELQKKVTDCLGSMRFQRGYQQDSLQDLKSLQTRLEGLRTEVEMFSTKNYSSAQKRLAPLRAALEHASPKLRPPGKTGKPLEYDHYLSRFDNLHQIFANWHALLMACVNMVNGQAIILIYCHEQLPNFISKDFLSLSHPYVTLVDLLELEVRNLALPHPHGELYRILTQLFSELRSFDPAHPTLASLSSAKLILEKNMPLNADFQRNVLQTLINILQLEQAPLLLRANPFAKIQHAELEKRFFSSVFESLHASFLAIDSEELRQPFDTACRFSFEGHEQHLVTQLKRSYGRMVDHLNAWILKEKSIKVVEDPEKHCDRFLEEMRVFMNAVDAECEKASQLMSEKQPPPSRLCQILHGTLAKFKAKMDVLFVSYSQPLLKTAYAKALQRDSRIVATHRKTVVKAKPAKTAPAVDKTQVASPQSVNRPKASPIKTPKGIPEALKAFVEICQFLNTRFQTPHESPEMAYYSEMERKTAFQLHHLMDDFRELAASSETHGNHSVMILQVYLRVAIALEQAGKHVAARLAKPLLQGISDDLLPKGSLWQSHAPLEIIQRIEALLKANGGSLDLSAAQTQFLSDMEHVIDKTSRYPGIRQDGLTKVLKEKAPVNVKETLQTGIQICLKLLQQAIPKDVPLESSGPILTKESLEGLFAISEETEETENNLQALSACENALRSVELFRLSAAHRRLLPIHDWEEGMNQRQAALFSATQNLRTGIELSRELLVSPEEPSLCATWGMMALQLQGMLLEQMEVLLLAQLPIALSPSSSRHWLFDEQFEATEGKLLLHSHRLREFAKHLLPALKEVDPELEWCFQLEERSRILEPVMRELYRYFDPAVLTINRLYQLSSLRDRLWKEQINPRERSLLTPYLGDSDPIEQLARLDAHIIRILQTEYKAPLRQILWIVAEGLAIQEQLMLSQLNRRRKPFYISTENLSGVSNDCQIAK